MQDPHPHLNAPRDGYVFIVTYGRSGSTLLQNLLNAIPGYCIRGENANTLGHLVRAWYAIRWTPEIQGLRGEGAAATDPTHPWYGAELADPRAYGQALADIFVREVLAPPEGTRVAGFKEIRFHNDAGFFPDVINFLRWHFPGARFVYNTRDHAAVARSGWWANQPPQQVSERLARVEALFEEAAATFPRRSIRLHYDDYAGNPQAFAPLFEFLGEPFDAGLVEGVLARRLEHKGR